MAIFSATFGVSDFLPAKIKGKSPADNPARAEMALSETFGNFA
jgi:hypothetical protein